MGNEVQIVLTAVDKASGTIRGMNNSWKSVTAGIGAVVGVATAAGMALKQVVDQTVDYAFQVDDLSRSLGTNTEEASKLIQIADDLRIEVGTLETGFKSAIRQGINPNIEGIKKLAQEYQALPTPLAKSQFALEHFGKAGLDLNKILELTPEKLDEMAKSAADAGLVLGDKDVKAAKDFYAAMDNLNDSMDGLKIAIGKAAIPALVEFIDWVNEAINSGNILQAVWDRMTNSGMELATGVLHARTEWAGWENTVKESTPVIEKAGLTVEELNQKLSDLKEIVGGELGNEIEDFTTKQDDLTQQSEDLKKQIDELSTPKYLTNAQKIQLSDLRDSLEMVDKRIGRLEDRNYLTDAQKIKLEDLRTKSEKIQESIQKLEGRRYLTAAQKEELGKLREQLGEVKVQIGENADAHDEATKRILFNILTERAAVGGLTETEYNALLTVAGQWGLVDGATATAMSTADEFFLGLQEGVQLSTADVLNLDRAMRGLPAMHTFVVNMLIKAMRYGSEGPDTGPVNPHLPSEPVEPGQRIESTRGISITVNTAPGLNEMAVAYHVANVLNVQSRRSFGAGRGYTG